MTEPMLVTISDDMSKVDKKREEIHKRGIEVFGSIHGYMLWGDSRIIALGGRKPLTLLELGEYDLVEQALDTIESGNFA